MARRIAAAILLTVWAILVAGGFAAYWVTRVVLVRDLDRSLVRAAQALPQVAGGQTEGPGDGSPATAAPEDRYVIKNYIGQTVGSPADRDRQGASARSLPPYSAAFAPLGGGRRVRVATVHLVSADAGTPITVVYSRPTDSLDAVLATLALALTLCGLSAGAGAAGVAVVVARTALRPLHDAADVIGVIDEQKLDRRIDADSLPPELRPSALRLNGMLERLEHAFAQRRQFLADASHELRTPVAALVTTLEVALRRKRDAAELTRTLEACLGDARYLRRLVTTLLEHARGEATRRAPAPEPFDAADLLDHCAALAEAAGASKGVRVVRSYRRPMPVVAEPDRVRGVLTNLLSNAIDYSPPEGVVELSARLEDGALEVSVSDSGPGIPAEHVPSLFQPFYRASASRWLGGGGEPHLGLGLFIVDAHLKALGGRCSVDSKVGVGTTFRVTIPAAAPEAAEPAAPTTLADREAKTLTLNVSEAGAVLQERA